MAVIEDRPSWDPRHEACTPALTTDRTSPVLNGLVEILTNADRITAVCGSTPGETLALVEYLLGIVHASGHVPQDDDTWADWVEDRTPLEPAATWLEAADPEDWDLFHPTRPLGQNSLLAPWLTEHGVGPAQLVIEHAGDYNQHFDHHHLHHPAPLPAAEAWRAMLTQHAYGIGGKTKTKADWLGKNLPNGAVGRLGQRIRVLALGDTLGDTLRLNLTPGPRTAQGALNSSWTTGRSRRSFTGPKADAYRTVGGPADLHTVLGRSILLRPVTTPDGVAVDRVLMGAGELLSDLPDTFLQDAVMQTTTKDGKTQRLFLKASESRALWREAHALYAAVAKKGKGTDLYGRLAMLGRRRTPLWAVGLVAGNGKAVTWVADTFPTVPGRETALLQAATEAASIVEHASKALYAAAATAREIAYPNPTPREKAKLVQRFNGSPQLYAAAADHFHMLLDDVADGIAPAEALTDYATELAALTRRCLAQRLRSLPPSGDGHQARAEAEHKLNTVLANAKSPHHLKEAATRA
ncbi:type I-E CRISPR-associated protein Cse1/CasA [Streptomyces sp. NPDC055105]|uniref:type I-E CRISPR-associated protein Cse1/CasA n=1 Tax=Streptomyces sp. NPDC055105 TaxID=3365719 RepID=UPI0037CE032A